MEKLNKSSVKIIKVAKSSDPKKVAGTVRYYTTSLGRCELHALGNEAISVTVKSLALLNDIFKFDYKSKVSYFHFVNDDNKKQSGLAFKISK